LLYPVSLPLSGSGEATNVSKRAIMITMIMTIIMLLLLLLLIMMIK